MLKVARNLCVDDTRNVTYVEKVFRVVDKSGCGTISVSEFQDALERLGVASHDEEAHIFSKWYDVNSDGRISYPEFVVKLVEFMMGCRAAASDVDVPQYVSNLPKSPGMGVLDRIAGAVMTMKGSRKRLRSCLSRASMPGYVPPSKDAVRSAVFPDVNITKPVIDIPRPSSQSQLLLSPVRNSKLIAPFTSPVSLHNSFLSKSRQFVSPTATSTSDKRSLPSPGSGFVAKLRAATFSGDALSILPGAAASSERTSSVESPSVNLELPSVLSPALFIGALAEAGVALDPAESELLLTMLPRKVSPKGGAVGVDVSDFMDRLTASDTVRRFRIWMKKLKDKAAPLMHSSDVAFVLHDVKRRLREKHQTRRSIDVALAKVMVCDGLDSLMQPCTPATFLSDEWLACVFSALGVPLSPKEVSVLIDVFDPTGGGSVVCGAVFDALAVVFPHAPVMLSPSTVRMPSLSAAPAV